MSSTRSRIGSPLTPTTTTPSAPTAEPLAPAIPTALLDLVFPRYRATIKLFDRTSSQTTVYLGSWQIVGADPRRLLWQCSSEGEVLEHFLPSDNPNELFPYTLHAQHRRFDDPRELELYVTFIEPHRVRYTTTDGIVHDDYIQVKYEFTTIEGSIHLQSDLRQKELIDWFDVDVVWSETHRRTDSYGNLRGLGTIQRIKLWRDRHSTFHSLTFYANQRRRWMECPLHDFDPEPRHRDDRYQRIQLGVRSAKSSSASGTFPRTSVSPSRHHNRTFSGISSPSRPRLPAARGVTVIRYLGLQFSTNPNLQAESDDYSRFIARWDAAHAAMFPTNLAESLSPHIEDAQPTRAPGLSRQRLPLEASPTDHVKLESPLIEEPQRDRGPGLSRDRVPTAAFPTFVPNFVGYLMGFLPPPFREPPVPPGKGRVRWKCKCGAHLYDDFIERIPGSLRDLEAELRALNNGASQPGYQIAGGLTRSFSALGNLMKRMINSMRRGSANDDIPLPLRSDGRQESNPRTSETDLLHLLCCIHSGEIATVLHQERILHASTDRELFGFLNELYHKKRSIISVLSLRHLSKLLLARFELDFSRFVQVHLHNKACQSTDCVCLPPLDRVTGNLKEYSCGPAPEVEPKYVPVLGDNYLTHYFKHPQCVSEQQTTIFNQLPKRACGQLAASHQELSLGWGLYFEEGWNWRLIYFVLVVLIVTAGLVFGICWSVFRADVQSAFAITSSWMTVGSLLLGYLAVRSF